MEAGEIISINLKRLRKERNLSLGQLADMAGLSKVVLSQIEKGDANPTINTIWKIAGALGLPYTSLLEMEPSRNVCVRKKDVSELCEDGYSIFNYYAKNAERNFEIYEMEMETGCDHLSVGHSSKSLEYLLITEGSITVTANEQQYVLNEGDALCFSAESPHRYVNSSLQKAVAVLIIQYF